MSLKEVKMKVILKTIKQYLDNNGLSYQYREERNVFYFQISTDIVDIDFFVQIQKEAECILFIATLPITIEESKADAMLKLINTINAQTTIASLYMESSKIYAQSFVLYTENSIVEDLFLRYIALTVSVLNGRVKEIFRIVFGNSNNSELTQLFLRQIKEDTDNNLIFN